mmetsp:Transcript_47927/g.95042  ORF Transcript_47927/g.95042 Transcript_47927/m.95042 type:complete len:248 (+) Transcript_47927:194-937(+)
MSERSSNVTRPSFPARKRARTNRQARRTFASSSALPAAPLASSTSLTTSSRVCTGGGESAGCSDKANSEELTTSPASFFKSNLSGFWPPWSARRASGKVFRSAPFWTLPKRSSMYATSTSSPTTESFTAPVSASRSPTSTFSILGTRMPGVSRRRTRGISLTSTLLRARVTPGRSPTFARCLALFPPALTLNTPSPACSAPAGRLLRWRAFPAEPAIELINVDFPTFGTPATMASVPVVMNLLFDSR